MEDYLKRVAWKVGKFKGGASQKRGHGVFEEDVDTPLHTMSAMRIRPLTDPTHLGFFMIYDEVCQGIQYYQ